MRKKLSIVLILCVAFTMFAGCSKKSSDSSSSTSGNTDSGLSYEPTDYVTLGDYKGLEGYDITCEVTEDEVQDEIDSSLAENATYTEITDRGAKSGDYVTFDYSASIDGTAVEDCAESDYSIQLGNEEFNETIEEAMLGKKAEEEFTVDMEIPEDLSATNAGEKATFTVTITKLELENIPEYTVDYVKENTDYDTKEDYEASIKESLLSDKEDEYYYEVVYSLIDSAIAAATFKEDYPEELYTQCETEFNESVAYYAQMFGIESEEYLTDFCGYTDEDVKNEILTAVHEKLVVYAIAEAEGLFLSDDDYDSYVDALVSEYGYDSAEDFEADYGKDVIIYAAVYDNVSSLLYENAELKTISEEEYQEMAASEEAEEADEADEEEIETEEESTEE